MGKNYLTFTRCWFKGYNDSNLNENVVIYFLNQKRRWLNATKGTGKFLQKNKLDVTLINKVKEGSPHIVDSLLLGNINLVINTTKTQNSISDSYSIRRTSLMNNIPYYTTMEGAKVSNDKEYSTRLITIKTNKILFIKFLKFLCTSNEINTLPIL